MRRNMDGKDEDETMKNEKVRKKKGKIKQYN